MREISGSQLFRTTIGIQSGPCVFDISRLVITFPTNREITEILCSFRLIVEVENKQISDSSESWEQRFLEVIGSFVLVEYASLTASGTLSQ